MNLLKLIIIINLVLVIQVQAEPDYCHEAGQLLFTSYEAGYFIMFEGEGAQFLTEGVQVLQKIANDYPTCTLATTANQALGNSLVFQGDYQEAIPYLEASKHQPIGFSNVLHTHVSLYKAYMGLNNTSKAEEILHELKEAVSTKFKDYKLWANSTFEKEGIPLLFNYDDGVRDGKQQCIDSPESCGNNILTCSQGTSYNVVTGKLHSPCIKVYDALGNITTYEATLNQQFPSFTFDLGEIRQLD